MVRDAPPAFHIMAKPSGAICNLKCAYCFFLEKERLYPDSDFRMSGEVMEEYISQYIGAQQVPEVTVAWQGGEPTLMGLDFFRRTVEAAAEHAPPGMRIAYTMQTNGILLDDAWCEFLRANHFLIGLSMDGPARTPRRQPAGQGRSGHLRAGGACSAPHAAARGGLQRAVYRERGQRRPSPGGLPLFPGRTGRGVDPVHPHRGAHQL